MNTKMEVYKNSLHLSDQQVISVIKKARYIVSKLCTQKIGCIEICLGNLLVDKADNDLIFGELKKLTNMIIHLIQIDVIDECNICLDSLVDEKHFIDILRLIKFSGITNKFYITAKILNDDKFLVEYPELNIEIDKKRDIIFNKRYVLDLKQEFVCREDIQGEKDVR